MSNFKWFGKELSFSLLFVLVLALSGFGQTVTGNISGTVTDPSGGVIPNATVTLISEKTGETRNVNTNDEGRFVFQAVQPDTYTVKIEVQGFQTLDRKNTVLSASENLALGEIVLTAGKVSETVTVVSEGAKVETESSDLTARLTSDQIDLISTKGRDITSLLRLIPGTTNENDVESYGEGFGTDLPFISGQRGRSTVPTIDGLNAGEPSGSNKLSMSINQDAVAEVKILRNNYAAEYGNNGGAIISIVSKGGGKNYKGSAYYFLRNEALNANSFFNNKAGLPKPLYRHNIWGFNFGGPMPLPKFGESEDLLVKKKAFFFISLEKPHTISPTNPIFVVVPTALERAGDFSQSNNGQPFFIADPLLAAQGKVCTSADTSGCFTDPSRASASNPTGLNIIPLSRFNPSTASFLKVFPLPNAAKSVSSAGNQYNYINQRSTEVPKRSFLMRYDFKPTKNDTAYVKVQWFRSDNIGLGTSGWPSGDTSRWGILSHYLYNDDGWAANWNHVFNKSMVNEFSFGMRHDSEGFVPDESTLSSVLRSTNGYTAPQLFPENNHLGAIPKVTNWGGVSNAAQINWLDRWGEIGNDYVRPSFSDNFSYNRGNHNYKAGLYYERMLNGEAAGSTWAGTLSFANSGTNWTAAAGNTGNPYANALLGNFQQYQETQFRPHTDIEMRMLQWYVQDQWKVNRRLSLSYGMRWGWHTPYYQRNGIGSSFDPSLYNFAAAQRFYANICTAALTTFNPGTTTGSCPSANRLTVDPANPSGASVSSTLNRSYVPGSGSILNGVELAKDPNTPKGYRKFRLPDWEPRIGFAYDLTGKAKTVLRGMFGIYHTPRAGGGTTGDLTGNPPEQRTWTINNGNIDNLPALLVQVKNNELTLPWGSVRGLEIQSHTPEMYNFSFGVQQDLGFGTVIEVSYVGSRGRWLGEQRNINAIPDAAKFVNCTLAATFNVPCHPENREITSSLSTTNITSGAKNNDQLRPFPGYGDISFVTWGGNSKYDSLQIQMNRRYAKGFQYGVAYTYSKSFDSTSDDRNGLFFATGTAFGGRDYNRFNWAPSDFDQRHVFTVNYIYDVPLFNKSGNGALKYFLGGWQVSGTTSFATGKPLDIQGASFSYSSTSVSISNGQTCPEGSIAGTPGTTTTTCTPITDFTGGSQNAIPFTNCKNAFDGATGTDNTGTKLAINISCFTRPTKLGDTGNIPRNFGRLPNIFNTDLAFFKNFRWGEKRGIQFRWEIYNLFNRANFSGVDTGMTFGLVQINPGGAGATCNATNICTAQYQQTNARFGAVTSARSPRVQQASLRINF